MFCSVRREFVQHLRHRLNLGSGKHDVWPADCYVRVRRVGRKLVTDERIKPDALPAAFAQEDMSGRLDWMRPLSDGRNSSIERLPWRVDIATTATSARTFLTRWSKLGDQQLLMPFDLLAFGYVA